MPLSRDDIVSRSNPTFEPAPGVLVPSLAASTTATTYRSARATQTISSSTALTSILSQSIPAGQMGVNGALRVMLHSKLDIAAAETVTIQISLGGTTLYKQSHGGLGPGTGFRMPIQFVIRNLNAKDSQILDGFVSGPAVNATAEVTGFSEAFSNAAFVQDEPSSIDTGVVQTLDVSVQHSVSNAGNTWTCYGWLIEVI